jgi:hypothetical protein
MNILITGGTGFIGSALSVGLLSNGHNVIITSRHRNSLWYEDRGILKWRPPDLIPKDIMSRIGAIVNLAGEPITSGRWTKARKDRILSSRIETTRAMVESMRAVKPVPGLLISASAIGYYGPRGDEYITEEDSPGEDFLAQVCKSWEEEALKAQDLGVRVVLLRIGIVLGSGGGALPRMALPFKLFLGGSIGSGRQWFSWIHIDDVVGIIRHIIENATITGPVNLTAPQPVTNKEFSSTLARVLGRPAWLPVPALILKIALGELADVLLTGQRVLPEKILKAGYKFKYPGIEEALRAIY